MIIILNDREAILMRMAVENQIEDFDRRLLQVDNGGAYNRAYTMRCELKALSSKLVPEDDDGLIRAIEEIANVTAEFGDYLKIQAD